MKGADVISTPFLDSSPRAPKHLFLFFLYIPMHLYEFFSVPLH